ASFQILFCAQHSVDKFCRKAPITLLQALLIEKGREHGGGIGPVRPHTYQHLGRKRPSAHPRSGPSCSTELPEDMCQRFWISFLNATPIKNKRSAIPRIWATSRTRIGKLRRVTPSIRKNKKCPPSRTGIGSRFSSPRLMLIMAITQMKYSVPLRRSWPAIS